MPIVPGPRVLSIKQPYAWAILTGRKKVENGVWTTPYRGEIYIHAGGRQMPDGAARLATDFRMSVPNDLPLGAVIATAQLTDVVTKRNAKRFGKWFGGPYGWVLENVRPLRKPVKIKGQLGLYRPSKGLQRAVEQQRRRR